MKAHIKLLLVTLWAVYLMCAFTIVSFSFNIDDSQWSNWDPGNNGFFDTTTMSWVYQETGLDRVYRGDNNLLGNPLFTPNVGTNRCTFYGDTDLNASENMLGGEQEYRDNTFKSTVDIDASGYTNSYSILASNDFDNTTSVTANAGTVIQMDDNNFNGTTSINASSGGTVNVQIGNSTEMQQLLSDTSSIKSLNTDIKDILNDVKSYLYRSGINLAILKDHLTYNYFQPVSDVDGTRTFNAGSPFGNITYNLPKGNFYTYTYQDEHIVRTTDAYYYTFMGMLRMHLVRFQSLLWSYSEMISSWFYPLRSDKYYFRFYNTDTGKQESTNLAGILYHISWYVGQLYNLGTTNQSLSDFSSKVEEVTDTFKTIEQTESNITDTITDRFDNLDLAFENSAEWLNAVRWCSSYLQKVYVALGAYGYVITVALLLGLCMQFIGYFKYKV